MRGQNGANFEINPEREKIWEYINPVTNNGFLAQGETPANNIIFRAYRYPLDYPAFAGREFDEPTPLENNPFFTACTLTDTESAAEVSPFKLYPNPTTGMLQTEQIEAGEKYLIADLTGRVMMSGKTTQRNAVLNLSDLAAGIYFLKIEDRGPVKVVKI